MSYGVSSRDKGVTEDRDFARTHSLHIPKARYTKYHQQTTMGGELQGPPDDLSVQSAHSYRPIFTTSLPTAADEPHNTNEMPFLDLALKHRSAVVAEQSLSFGTNTEISIAVVDQWSIERNVSGFCVHSCCGRQDCWVTTAGATW
ncbi:hypothetical protein PENFLA_c009G09994 [Penicillium flavigenum]|uniref:Uncharacterized protein n=1 Tax=Penicillium flavigenum TaxID=254877 RepID=A0A1V6TEJ1_9EURO|nr:hypothetical protein PENFLA_c009G09994 [Penicillium flavigenum]